MEAKLTPSKPGETGGAELSPLEFLLGVMTDPEVKPQQRIKAARIAARYKHPQADGGQAPVVIEDKYGFKIDLELAKSIRDDRVRSRSIYDTGDYMFYQGSPRQAEFDRESAEIGARFVEYRKELNARPAAYTREEEMKDWRRIEEFFKRRRLRQTLSQEELLEEAILYTRGVDPSPPAPRRLVTLKEAVEMYDRAEAERLKKNSESTSPTNPISNGA
jgi:hypothetical protein